MAACQQPDKKVQRLVHRRVYIIPDSSGMPNQRPFVLPPDTSYLEHLFKSYGLVNIRELDSSIYVKLRYADTANFLRINFYDGLRHAYFPCEVAIRLCNAQHYLKQVNPGLSLLILDATRPLHIQQLMWDSLKMLPDKKFNYLAPPYETSLHNYGCAVDLTIINLSENKSVDMGTDFDAFTHLSQPAFEWKFLKSGELSREAYDNRRLLRYVMKQAGFNPIPSEWWHFSYGGRGMAASKFELIK